MKKLRSIYKNKVKMPPGTLPDEVNGPKQVKYTVIEYSSDHASMNEYHNLDDCLPDLHSSSVSWINIDGIHSSAVVESLGKEIELHPLVMEDIMNPLHRPKFEDFDNHIFVIFKIMRFDKKNINFSEEQVSLILGENYVITFQEYKGDIFDPVRKRIDQGQGRIRRMKSDYLFCSLLDMVIDNYYPILEDLDEVIEEMDEKVHLSSQALPSELYKCQKQVNFLHRSTWPMRDVISDILRSENTLINGKTRLYFKDLNDHILQIIDLADSFRDNVNALMELSIAINGDKLNRIMKFLTLVSTIFIPLSFIAGLYGMNFKNMPELETRYGYYIVLGVMLSVLIGMVMLFKKRKWF
ncbi:MAG: magnesium/cobalt transporter CorA [Spirochaetales bacterium]|nr:magnesium/cobalt transporter CorA [Spirochaetales bacterium]